MLSLDPGFLWAGLAAGALLCLAAFKRRGFLFIAVGAAGCAAMAALGTDLGRQETAFALFLVLSAPLRLLVKPQKPKKK